MADIAGFAAVFALLAWTGSRRAHGDNEFLVADRSLGLFPLVATLVMTEFNSSTLLAFSAAGYRAGPMALALPFVFLVGLTFYTVTVARAWKRFDRLSVAELFAVRYSPALGRLVSVLLLLAMTGFSATYVESLTMLAEPFLPGVPFFLLSAALTAVVLMVVLPGGLMSVVRSDVVSFVITLVVVPLLLVIGAARSAPLGGLAAAFPPDQLSFSPVAQWGHPELPFRFVSTLIVLTCFTYIAAPWLARRSSPRGTSARPSPPSRGRRSWCSRSTASWCWPPRTSGSCRRGWRIPSRPCRPWWRPGCPPACAA